MQAQQQAEFSYFYSTINRASSVLNKAFLGVSQEIEKLTKPTHFTYWDTYGNNKLPDTNKVDNERLIQLIYRGISNRIGSKHLLAGLLKKHDLTHLAPPTFNSVKEAVDAKLDNVSVWFFKPAYGTGGKGMFCVANRDLPYQVLPKDYVIQAGVRDIELDKGRKFTTRFYLLLHDKKLYFFNNGFNVVHGHNYDPYSTAYEIQIDHTGYANKDSPVTMVAGSDSFTFKQFVPALKKLTKELIPVLSECLEATDKDSYLILGIDTLLCKDGTVKLIEINIAPNFIHTNDIISKVNVPFFESVLRVLLGHTDSNLKEVT